MIDAVVRFYKWSPVVANLILAGVVILLFTVIAALGGPAVDMTWLLGALGLGSAVVNFKSVTSPRTVEKLVSENSGPTP